MPSYTDEQLLAMAHLGEAVIGPELRAEIVACQARTKAQDANSTILGPAILGEPVPVVVQPEPVLDSAQRRKAKA